MVWGQVTIGFNRHAGPVPASTAPHNQRPMGVRDGGCRHEAGMTKVEQANHISKCGIVRRAFGTKSSNASALPARGRMR